MRRLALSIALAASLMVGSTPAVGAASANISPYSQTHSYGVASHWTLTWSGYSPFEVLFDRGDSTGVYWPSTTSTSSSQSYTYYPCVTTKYFQYLDVWDSHSAYANDNGWAREGGGPSC